jgi:hypothetical protein
VLAADNAAVGDSAAAAASAPPPAAASGTASPEVSHPPSFKTETVVVPESMPAPANVQPGAVVQPSTTEVPQAAPAIQAGPGAQGRGVDAQSVNYESPQQVPLMEPQLHSLQEFINAHGEAAQKADAETALANVNTEAAAKLKEVKDAVANLDVPAALAAWDKYAAQVKDAGAAAEVAAARQELETKAEQLTQEEIGKAAEKARKYNYAEALNGMRLLLKRLAGLKKCEEPLKAKEEALRRQKGLHDKFLAAAADKLRAGAIPVPFIDDPKFHDVKWKISGIKPDQVMLDAMSGGALGISKRIGELKPDEQYKLYMLFLPKDLSTDDQKALAAFCKERGLAAEEEAHAQKAVGGQ